MIVIHAFVNPKTVMTIQIPPAIILPVIRSGGNVIESAGIKMLIKATKTKGMRYVKDIMKYSHPLERKDDPRRFIFKPVTLESKIAATPVIINISGMSDFIDSR